MTQLMLPVSEEFHSLQGEGTYTGTPMHFIRLAGCNVGKHPIGLPGMKSPFPTLKTGRTAYRCGTYDNRAFWCDTDFQHGTPTSLNELIANTWEHHICLTGGEPLLHRGHIEELVQRSKEFDVYVHVETSGTIVEELDDCWITVSPKFGFKDEMVHRADEVKLLIDDRFKLSEVPESIQAHVNVFIQPINEELTVNTDNLELCRKILREKPHWKLSFQMHKFVNWR